MTSQETTTDLSILIDRYIAVWNETGPSARHALIEETWADDGSYRDPVLAGHGHDGIDQMTAGYQQAYPGHTFEWDAESLDERESRFTWRLRTPEGDIGLAGQDVYTLAGDGRLQSIVGSFTES